MIIKASGKEWWIHNQPSMYRPTSGLPRGSFPPYPLLPHYLSVDDNWLRVQLNINIAVSLFTDDIHLFEMVDLDYLIDSLTSKTG